MADASPTIRRRELGARLRALRQAANLTVEDVAARMEVSATKISRLETAARGVSIPDVRALCDIYEVSSEDRDRLLALTRESRRRSWWQEYGLPDSLATYIGLEDAAISIHQYETSVVPGLLQTEDYARAATSGALPDATGDAVEHIVSARLARQKLLRTESAPELWVVLDEVALHRIVGSVTTMRDQMAALVERSKHRKVTVQVVPLDAGAHPGVDSAFEILHLADVSDVVHVEGLLGSFFLQSPADLVRYQRAFDQLRAIALSPRSTRTLLTKFAEGLPSA